MTKQLSVVNTAADTFEVLINRVNELVITVNSEVITANSSNGGGLTTGNSWLYGIFGANTIVAPTLRGGNVESSGVLTITSNVVAQSFISVGNSTVNAVINSTTFAISNLTANAVLTAHNITLGSVFANASVLRVGNSTVNATVNSSSITFSNSSGSAVLDGSIVTTLSNSVVFGSATTSGTNAQIIDSTTRASYRSFEYVVSIKQDGVSASQLSKILVLDGENDALLSEYGVLISNGSLGNFSANANTTHVRLIFTPTVANTTIKFCKIRLEV